MDPFSSQRYRYGGSQRLRGRRAFAAVFDARCRKHAGPIVVCGRPNELGYCRLGLCTSRKVGSAVTRNRIKRLLREAFRLRQYDLCQAVGGYDIAVVVRPHAPAKLAQYQQWLTMGVLGLRRQWRHRCKREMSSAV